MNKKGITIVELVVSFSLAAVISLFLIQVVLFLRDTYVVNGVKSEIALRQSIISDRINSLFLKGEIVSINDECGDNCLELTFSDGDVKIIQFDNNGNKIVVGDYITTLPQGTQIENINFLMEKIINPNSINDGILKINAILVNSLISEIFNINTLYQFNSNQSRIVFKGVAINFTYTETEQIFIVPKTGYYKLEVWGAQGGYTEDQCDTATGGYGGYSIGQILLEEGEILYINVGGQGSELEDDSYIGGYNGGGSGGAQNTQFGAGGGGATSIAKRTGLLSSLSSYVDDITIVAGGGGGSGYIGNTSLTDKYMYCYQCNTTNEEATKTFSTTDVSLTPIRNYAKIGDGYAKITYLGS